MDEIEVIEVIVKSEWMEMKPEPQALSKLMIYGVSCGISATDFLFN